MAVAQRNENPPTRSNGGRSGGRDPWKIEPTPAGLIDSPLDFIFAEHYRQREAATILVMIADGDFDEAGVAALIAFFEQDFALHIGDEEIVLFPVLREHCLPEDNVDRIIKRLQDEHRDDERISEEVIDVLKARLAGRRPGKSEKRRLRLFAEHIRQHLALENGVLLPIARVRLGGGELKILAEMLKNRRAEGRRCKKN